MPNWEQYLRRGLKLPEMQGGREERMLRELAQHLEGAFQDALRNGATPELAELQAKESLGDLDVAAAELTAVEPDHHREQASRWVLAQEKKMSRRGGGWSLLADAGRELRLATRVLRRYPGFSATVILVLAIGIGGAAAIFTVVNSALLSPLPFVDPHNVVSVFHTAPEAGFDDAGQCAAWHYTYRSRSETLSAVGMYGTEVVSVTGDGRPEALSALLFTSGVNEALGVAPLLGRPILPGDESPQATPVVWLTNRYWSSRYGGSEEVLGRVLRVDGRPHQIVGVFPGALDALGQRADLVLPMQADQSSLYVGNIGFGGVARLADGETMASARQELQRILPSAWERFPGGPIAAPEDIEAFSVAVVPLKERLVGGTAPVLWVLLLGVLLLLLVACANVANLLLTRSAQRQTELELRGALGASHFRVHWEHLKEALILASVGGVCGLLLARLGLLALLAAAPAGLPDLGDVALDWRVVAVTLSLAVACGVLIGLVPALLGRKHTSAAQGLRSSSAAVGSSSSMLLRASACAQVALVFVLLVAAGLMFRSSQNLRNVTTGMGSPDQVLAMRLQIPPGEIKELEQVAAEFDAIVQRLLEVQGVESATLATSIPMDGHNNVNSLFVESSPRRSSERGIIQRHKWVSGDYFSTLQVPLVAGREIEWRDVRERLPNVVVSESLAREYWGSARQAIGQRVAARPEPVHWFEVVGVAADVRDDGLAHQGPAMVYWPQVTTGFWKGTTAEQIMLWRDNGIAVRSGRLNSPNFHEVVRRAIWEVNPRLPVTHMASLEELASGSTAATSYLTILLALSSGLALLLGLTGIYGLISNQVAQQTRELGIRTALGASARRVQLLMLRQGFAICALGLVAGGLLTYGLGSVLKHVLFGVSPTDPVTVVVAAFVLLLVVLAACLPPARRAAAIDPVEVLRS